MTRSGTTPPPPPLSTGGLESAAGTADAERAYPCLDGLRALAALAVVFTHIGFLTGRSLHGHVSTLLARGDFGVAVFFVLSGFLLYRPLVGARLAGRPYPSVRPYLWRRALRILPAYWVTVALVLGVLGVNRAHRGDAGEWLRQLLLLQTTSPGHLYNGLSHLWSLSVEVSFYLLLPLWPRLLDRLPGARAGSRVRQELIALALLAASTYVWDVTRLRSGWHDGVQAGYWLPTYADWFAAGMVLALAGAVRDTGGRMSPRAARRWQAMDEVVASGGLCWTAAGALLLLTLTPLAGPYDLALPTVWQTVIKHVLYGVAALLLVAPATLGARTDGGVRGALATPLMRWLGIVSYGIFLLHPFVLELVYQLGHLRYFGGHLYVVTAIVLPVSVLLAYLSLRLVEEPALRLRRLVPTR